MGLFEPANEKTGGHEGGYSKNPNDRGGETIFGIARKFWGDWEGWSILDTIKIGTGVNTKEERRELTRLLKANTRFMGMVDSFYEENFFHKYHLDIIDSQPIVEVTYDILVNGGRPFTWMQELLNIQNRQEKDWDDITVDGKFGNMSIKTLNDVCGLPKKYDFTSEFILLDKLLSYRDDYFKDITLGREENEDFYNGWSIRTIKQRIEYYRFYGVV